jgi:hypothetical protein
MLNFLLLLLLVGNRLCNLWNKCFFCKSECASESLLRISRKGGVSYNILMQIISKKICTINSTVSIIDSEKAAFWPIILLSFICGSSSIIRGRRRLASSSRGNLSFVWWEDILGGLCKRSLHVQNNWDSVFIVVSNNSLICICSIGTNHSVFFVRGFRILIIWNFYFANNFFKIILIINNFILDFAFIFRDLFFFFVCRITLHLIYNFVFIVKYIRLFIIFNIISLNIFTLISSLILI